MISRWNSMNQIKSITIKKNSLKMPKIIIKKIKQVKIFYQQKE